jgi:tellurite resistance protein TerC
MFRRTLSITYRVARRIAVAVIGLTLVLLGVAMLVLPGPGLLTIILGLMLLGVEFAFARRWLARIKRETRKTAQKVSRTVLRRGTPPTPLDEPLSPPPDETQHKY